MKPASSKQREQTLKMLLPAAILLMLYALFVYMPREKSIPVTSIARQRKSCRCVRASRRCFWSSARRARRNVAAASVVGL